ncbi:hypothetical protein DPMN_011808 [Dreissena polymorpha]|uniref:Uncharacterized protein n=1 Tax=Dreissena polymorpha TaxID=45954 RepID=A0A9D4N4Q5_DREPO|nr:hypothetical protein DPMN_011808 [Dreissena polymorpha]
MHAKVDKIVESQNAQEYVDAIMSSQVITKVNTQFSRKRSQSDSSQVELEGSTKKRCGNARNLPGAVRRSLYNESDSGIVITNADVHVDSNPTVEQLVLKLSSDMLLLCSNLNERMDKMESNLEQKITTKISQLLDKRISSEVSRIRKDVDSKLTEIRSEIKADLKSDLDEMSVRMDSLAEACKTEENIDLNVVIRNLPESQGENIEHKVSALFREGLKLPNVHVSSVTPKQSADNGNGNKNGVVIVKFQTAEDKKMVMTNKKDLFKSRQYVNVYINHDQLKNERLMANNFRTLLAALRQNDNRIGMRGSRVVIMNNYDSRQDGFSDSMRDNDGFRYNSRGNNFDNRITSDNGGVPNNANRGSSSGNRGSAVGQNSGALQRGTQWRGRGINRGRGGNGRGGNSHFGNKNF